MGNILSQQIFLKIYSNDKLYGVFTEQEMIFEQYINRGEILLETK